MLAAEAARRTSRKLTDHSALLVDVRLQREVERVYQQHQLPGTGKALVAEQLDSCLLLLVDTRKH